jgi:hypothetical protein
VRLFANAENLMDFRQTHYNPLLRPTKRWTVDAPFDIENINVGVQAKF